MSNKAESNEIHYEFGFLKRPKWIIILFSFFLFILIWNFPLQKKIDNLIRSSLKISASCRLQLEDYEFNIFPLPHLSIQNLSIPGSCMGPGSQKLYFKELRTYFRGPNFSPVGALFKVETTVNSLPVELFVTAGFGKIAIVMKESIIPLEKLRNFMPNLRIAGEVKTDLYVELSGQKINNLNLNLRSKDILIPAQSISGFALKSLNIGDMQLIATGDDKMKLKITKFVLGNESSPVRSSFTGSIALDMRRPMQTQINLTGELALSEELNNSFGFVLGGFDKKDNFYQIKIKGPPAISSFK